ncbi:Peptidase_S78_2 domain-containing protein [Vibrio phage vB_VcorM_GR7B]|nr:Peptidase_S78_2 domain-containing protein [Vibrio phage vB_VcorM_GR7B]
MELEKDKWGNVVWKGHKFPGIDMPIADRGNKQGKVLVRNGDSYKVVRFGDENLDDNYSTDANDRYYARHGEEDIKDKTSPKYWSHKWLWPRGKEKGKGPKKFFKLKTAASVLAAKTRVIGFLDM